MISLEGDWLKFLFIKKIFVHKQGVDKIPQMKKNEIIQTKNGHGMVTLDRQIQKSIHVIYLGYGSHTFLTLSYTVYTQLHRLMT